MTDYYTGYQNPSSPFTGILGQNADHSFNRTLGKVSDGISQMSTTYMALTKMTKDLGGPRDSAQLRAEITQKIKAIVATVRDIQNFLHQLDKLAADSRAREKKERIKQITQKFDNFNQKVTDICATAREKIADLPVHVVLDIDVPDSHLYSTPMGSRDQQQFLQQQQFAQLDSARRQQDEEIEMREREMKRLQGQMIEVNGIYKDLAELVNASAPLVHSNIMTSHNHVISAGIALKEAEGEQKSSRQKLCWIAFGVAIAICFILIVVVLSTKNP